jgi:hypothetical protein
MLLALVLLGAGGAFALTQAMLVSEHVATTLAVVLTYASAAGLAAASASGT